MHSSYQVVVAAAAAQQAAAAVAVAGPVEALTPQQPAQAAAAAADAAEGPSAAVAAAMDPVTQQALSQAVLPDQEQQQGVHGQGAAQPQSQCHLVAQTAAAAVVWALHLLVAAEVWDHLEEEGLGTAAAAGLCSDLLLLLLLG